VALYPSGQFADAGPVLSILAGVVLFLSLASVCATLLTGAGALAQIIKAYGVAVTIQVLGNLFLIPRHGAEGAAVSAVAATCVLAVLLVRAVRGIGVRVPMGSLRRHILGALVMGVVVYWLREAWLPIPLVAGMVTYGVVVELLAPAGSMERTVLSAARTWVTKWMANLRHRPPSGGEGAGS
jgi:O-antigen/teichoic acid export membrane protein